MLYEVEDNKLLSVRGNLDHPMTRGGLCVAKIMKRGIITQIDYYTLTKELKKR